MYIRTQLVVSSRSLHQFPNGKQTSNLIISERGYSIKLEALNSIGLVCHQCASLSNLPKSFLSEWCEGEKKTIDTVKREQNQNI